MYNSVAAYSAKIVSALLFSTSEAAFNSRLA